MVVAYQYTLHEAKAIFHSSIAPNPYAMLYLSKEEKSKSKPLIVLDL